MKSKKVTALVLVFVMLAGMLAACGKSPEPAGQKSGQESTGTIESKGSTESIGSTESTGTTELTGEITVWDIWPNEEDTNSRAWIALLPEFRAAYPNVTVNVDSTENEAYKTKFATAQAANVFPDVFFGWGPASPRELVAANMLLPLDDYLEADYKNDILPGTLDAFTFDGKIYGLTMFRWAGALYCNTELFEAHGIKLPETYDELFTAIEQFNAVGIVPIALPAFDAWTVAFFQHIMAIRYVGAENINLMLRGEKSFNDPGIIKSAQALLDLVDANAFDASALAMNYADVITGFLQGRYPMFYMGDWLIGEVMDPELSSITDKVVCINFPGVGGSYDDQILGGSTDGFMVNANSANVEVAVEFVKWMTARMPERGHAIGGAIPTRSNFDVAQYAGNLPPIRVGLAEFASKASGSTLAWDTFLPEVPRDRMLSMLQQLVGKQITAVEFAENMAAVMEETGNAKY